MDNLIANIDPATFTGSAFIIGILLINELDPAEQDSVANWLQLVGLVVQTYASQVSLIDSKQENKTQNSSKDDIETLKKAIQKMQEIINNL